MKSLSYRMDHTQDALASLIRICKIEKAAITRETRTEYHGLKRDGSGFVRVSSKKANEHLRSQVPFEGSTQDLLKLFEEINSKLPITSAIVSEMLMIASGSIWTMQGDNWTG